jgi:peptidoglycan/xylan/chitin deacetylase (PgdA/CDA1 family)
MSLSISFDDGHKTVYDNALPLMQNFGFKGTVFVCTERVGVKDFYGEPAMNLYQLRELESLGWEIGSHGKSHCVLTSLPYEKRKLEISESKEFLQRHGFKVSSFAYPYGVSDETTRKIVSKYYRCARSGFEEQGPYILEKTDFDPYCIPTLYFASFHFLKRVKRMNGWLTIAFHSISERALTRRRDNWISLQRFTDFLNNARNAGLESFTFVDAFDKIRETEGVTKLSAITCMRESLIARIWLTIDKISNLG